MRYRLCTVEDVRFRSHSLFPFPLSDTLLYSGGMIAPILGGILLMIDRSVPVYTSVVIFAFAGFCVLLLQEKPREAGKERVIAH